MKQKKLYSQTEIANIIGISKATVSRYLSKNNVTATSKNNAKLYPETILQQIKKAQKPARTKNKDHLSTIQLLQEQIAQLKEENKSLKVQLKEKDELLKTQLTIKDQQIQTAYELIEKTSTLVDQAQKLNALDKPKAEKPKKKKHWWQ